MPSSERETTSFWISVLAPMSMPRVGSSRISSFGWGVSQRARRTFCWFPPLHWPTPAPRGGGRPGPAAAGLEGEDDFLTDRQIRDQPLGLAVLRAERDPGADGVVRGAHGDLLAADGHRAAVRLVGAEEQPGQFGAAGAEQ